MVEHLEFGVSMMPLRAPTARCARRAPTVSVSSPVLSRRAAHASGVDPVQFARNILGPRACCPTRPAPPGPGFDTGRMRGVVDLVAEKSGWGTQTLPKGTGMGFAYYFSHLATSPR